MLRLSHRNLVMGQAEFFDAPDNEWTGICVKAQ
jgi:hypothetical protein